MIYKEEQKFNSLWIYLILCLVAIMLLYGVKNGQSLDLWHIFLIFTPIAFIIYLAEFSKLSTTINKEGISFRFKPFHKTHRLITWSEIKSVKTDSYRPLRDFGGWGVRRGKNGPGYNTKGNRGVFIELKDGKTIMIGTQQTEEVDKVINIHLKKRG